MVSISLEWIFHLFGESEVTRYIQLPDGNVITLHVFDSQPPELQSGWIRTVISNHWCVDERIVCKVANDEVTDWVDERTSE